MITANGEFIRQKVEQFMKDITVIDLAKEKAKENLAVQLLLYDKLLQDRFGSTYLKMANDQNIIKSRMPMSDQIEIEKWMNSTFNENGSVFNHTSQIKPAQKQFSEKMKDNVSGVMNKPLHDSEVQNLMSRDYQEFMRLDNVEIQNPLTFNNSLHLQRLRQEDIQLQKLVILKPAIDLEKQFSEKLKDNVNRLGGIEDTIGVMHKSLQDSEIQNMISRQYKEFMILDPYDKVEIQNKFLYQVQDSQIMNHNNQEHLMHAITKQLELTQGVTQQTSSHPVQQGSDKHIIVDEVEQHHMGTYNILSSIEQSKHLRRQKEQQLHQIHQRQK